MITERSPGGKLQHWERTSPGPHELARGFDNGREAGRPGHLDVGDQLDVVLDQVLKPVEGDAAAVQREHGGIFCPLRQRGGQAGLGSNIAKMGPWASGLGEGCMGA